ncbi:hypothetical protein RB195_019236 [Necator americanus]|uniref:Uncharacterized protein n=1 Tax=Necator americanus TaxID=51031 RepID=A0ABR1CD81_NECAM
MEKEKKRFDLISVIKKAKHYFARKFPWNPCHLTATTQERRADISTQGYCTVRGSHSPWRQSIRMVGGCGSPFPLVGLATGEEAFAGIRMASKTSNHFQAFDRDEFVETSRR